MESLNQVIASALLVPVESISDDASPATLSEWDSLAHFSLVTALQQKYSVEFTPDEIVELRDVPAIRRILHQKGARMNPLMTNSFRELDIEPDSYSWGESVISGNKQ